jgi:hypothetical protein
MPIAVRTVGSESSPADAMAVILEVCGPAIDEPTFTVNGGHAGADAR